MNFKLETYSYKIANRNELEADVYFFCPKSEITGVVFWIHGGALIFGDKKRIPNDIFKFVSQNKYLLVSLDHRYLPDYLVGDIVEDIIDGIHWFYKYQFNQMGICKLPYAVIGESSGAFLSLFTGFQKDNLPKVIGCYWGFSSLVEEWCYLPNIHYKNAEKVIPSIDGSPYNKISYFQYLKRLGTWGEVACGATQAEAPDYYKIHSPVLQIDGKFPPTVIVHGEDDFDIPFIEATRLAHKLSDENVASLLIKITKGGHLLFDSNNPKITNKVDQSFQFISDYMCSNRV